MARSHAHAAGFRTVLALFAMLGEASGIVILQRLARKPMTAGELAKGLSITRPAVVQHLKRLEEARLVATQQAGKRRVYRVRPEGFAPLAAWLEGLTVTARKTDELHRK